MREFKALEEIKKINPNLIKKNGKVKSFHEQLLEYKYKTFDEKYPFIVMESSDALGIADVKDRAIVMNASVIKKMERKHNINIDALINLSDHLENHVMGMESRTKENGILIVEDAKDKHDFQLMVAIHTDKAVNDGLMVHSIRSIYGRKNMDNLILHAVEEGHKIYPNERTEKWLPEFGKEFAKEISHYLKDNTYEVDTALIREKKLERSKKALEEKIMASKEEKAKQEEKKSFDKKENGKERWYPKRGSQPKSYMKEACEKSAKEQRQKHHNSTKQHQIEKY